MGCGKQETEQKTTRSLDETKGNEVAETASKSDADEANDVEGEDSVPNSDRKTGGASRDTAKVVTVDTVAGPKQAIKLMRSGRVSTRSLEGLPLHKLQVLRNAPFASAGYEFNTPWLSAYFRRMPERYNPGNFNDTELTDLEKRNAERIRKFEQSISKKELQQRWKELWEEYENTPTDDKPWETPRDWNGIGDRVEARLLAERLDIPYPEDPLFDEGASRPVSRGFAGIELGGDTQVELKHEFSRKTAALDFAWEKLKVGARVENGSVKDVIAGDFYHPHNGRPAPPKMQLAEMEARIIAAFGAPDTRDYESGWLKDAMLWRAGDRVMQIGFLQAPEEAGPVVAIRPADPTRPCGPKDGFEEDFNAVARAYDNNKMKTLKKYLSDVIPLQAVVITEDGELPERGELPINRATSYEEHFHIEEQNGDFIREADYSCHPLETHYRVTGIGVLPYVYKKIGGTWKLVNIQEWVAGTRRVSRNRN
ncbi:MAG: YARHG domain-containing protein [bacterium]